MSEDHPGRASAAFCVAEWLSLAAAPTFAVMALLTARLGGARPDMFCSAMAGASPLGGMVPMYLLMSAFHSAPWLKLISRRRISLGGFSSGEASDRRIAMPGQGG